MNASDFVELLDDILFGLLFIATAWHAIRRPSRASIDTALLFGAVVALLAIGPVADALGLNEPVQSAVGFVLLASLPYLLIRLVEDFSEPPEWLPKAGAGALVVIVLLTVLAAATGNPAPGWLLLINIAWFLGVGGYTGYAFLREAFRSIGLTRRRMQAVAAGSVLLMSAIVIALATVLVPTPGETALTLVRLMALAAGVAYFLGFAPPAILRRTWQQPELRAFLARASSLPRMPDTTGALRALEAGSASALGASHASIGLWNAETGKLHYLNREGTVTETGSEEFIGGQSFSTQQAIFAADATRKDPEHAEVYRSAGAEAVLAAPITAGENRLGVLTVYAARAPLFAEDDLHLLRLLADQAAVVLESRMLIDEAARVRAREEATRLKDDFLSAAAHDLRTPLTVLLGQAELLERRAARDPDAPADLARVERIAREARRLRTLVQDLLDASRVERGRLVADLQTMDLVEIATDVCARHATEHGDCLLQAEGPVRGQYDRTRIVQMLDNLIENARKYSRAGAPVSVRVWRESHEARIAVRDEGIGISAADVPHIFDRFYRGANVDDRRYAGMGLGLFICRGIAEQHGGRIWVESAPHRGSTFHVALPALSANAETEPEDEAAAVPRTTQPDVATAGGGQQEQPYAHG